MDNEYIAEELDEWHHIPSPSSMDDHKAQWISENNTLLIKDDFFNDCSVFPPTNHQDLPMINSSKLPSSPSLSASTISLSGDDDHDKDDESKVEESDGVKSEDGKYWRRMLVGAWRSRLVQGARKLKNNAACRISLWSSVFATTGVLSMVVMSLWCLRVQRWRKRVQMEKIEHLMLLIKDREQKINQLLLQIAQMNEMLLARRSVPVLRVS